MVSGVVTEERYFVFILQKKKTKSIYIFFF